MAIPKITLFTETTAIEGSTNGSYLITLDTPAPVGGLTVSYSLLNGSATRNDDYQFSAGDNLTALTSNSFTIAEGATTAHLNVVAVADAVIDPNETIIVNLQPNPGYELANSQLKFTPKVDYAVAGAGTLHTGDFNGDGQLDLAIATGGSTVSLLLHKSSGAAFQSTVKGVATGVYNGLQVADFNGDGMDNIAVITPVGALAGGHNQALLTLRLRNATNSGFDEKIVSEVGRSNENISGFKATDVDGDGKAEIAFGMGLGYGAEIWQNGITSFLPVYEQTGGIRVGDFNGDGQQDLAIVTLIKCTAN